MSFTRSPTKSACPCSTPNAPASGTEAASSGRCDVTLGSWRYISHLEFQPTCPLGDDFIKSRHNRAKDKPDSPVDHRKQDGEDPIANRLRTASRTEKDHTENKWHKDQREDRVDSSDDYPASKWRNAC